MNNKVDKDAFKDALDALEVGQYHDSIYFISNNCVAWIIQFIY